ncbi:unnamed protein product, partial [Ranitomeya imitator]
MKYWKHRGSESGQDRELSVCSSDPRQSQSRTCKLNRKELQLMIWRQIFGKRKPYTQQIKKKANANKTDEKGEKQKMNLCKWKRDKNTEDVRICHYPGGGQCQCHYPVPRVSVSLSCTPSVSVIILYPSVSVIILYPHVSVIILYPECQCHYPVPPVSVSLSCTPSVSVIILYPQCQCHYPVPPVSVSLSCTPSVSVIILYPQ